MLTDALAANEMPVADDVSDQVILGAEVGRCVDAAAAVGNSCAELRRARDASEAMAEQIRELIGSASTSAAAGNHDAMPDKENGYRRFLRLNQAERPGAVGAHLCIGQGGIA